MEMKDYWRFLQHVSRELRAPLQDMRTFADVMKDDEWRTSLADDERGELFRRLDRCLYESECLMESLEDLTYYSSVFRLERNDKVLVNRLCEELAEGRDVEVLFESDVPDYYAIPTNSACLRKVLRILLDTACRRVRERTLNEREPECFLTLTEHASKGKLTFAVSDTGDPATLEEDVTAFSLPAGQHGTLFTRRVEYYNCWQMVRLLGGFIYIDPKYRDGRRVIFSIDL